MELPYAAFIVKIKSRLWVWNYYDNKSSAIVIKKVLNILDNCIMVKTYSENI